MTPHTHRVLLGLVRGLFFPLFAVHVGLSAASLSELEVLVQENEDLRERVRTHEQRIDEAVDYAYAVCDDLSEIHHEEADICSDALHETGDALRHQNRQLLQCQQDLDDARLWNEATNKLLDEREWGEMNDTELFHQCHWDLGRCELDLHDAIEDLSRRNTPWLWTE